MGKNQHYIPQFYLRNFSDINQKAIGAFRFEEQRFIQNASIKEVAFRHHLYDKDDSVENFLADEERTWKAVLDIFLGRNVTQATLTMLQEKGEDFVLDLFRFFSITEARTTQLGDATSYIINSIEKQFGKEMPPPIYDEYFGNLEEVTKHPNIVPLMVAFDNIPFFAGLDLLVILNCTRRSFITSDVPVLNINPYYEKRRYMRNFGLVAMGLQKLLPISGQVCLCLYDRNVYRRKCKDASYILRSDLIVDQINKLIVENAYEQIFFQNNESEEYIKTLGEKRKKADHKGSIIFFCKDKPELISTQYREIRSDLLLPCLKIMKSSLFIPLPSHMGGLVRPEVQHLYDEKAKEYEMIAFNYK